MRTFEYREGTSVRVLLPPCNCRIWVQQKPSQSFPFSFSFVCISEVKWLEQLYEATGMQGFNDKIDRHWVCTREVKTSFFHLENHIFYFFSDYNNHLESLSFGFHIGKFQFYICRFYTFIMNWFWYYCLGVISRWHDGTLSGKPFGVMSRSRK